MKIYTKTGDAGETGLFGGGRVPKNHVRVEAYGAVDELNAAIGFARALEPVGPADALLLDVQRDLFAIGGRLASPDPGKVGKALAKAVLDDGRLAALEAAIDAAEAALPPLSAFVIPAGTPKAAALHVARTVCRRAERSVVTLSGQTSLPPVILPYLNRLSDLLFVLARSANAAAGRPDVAW